MIRLRASLREFAKDERGIILAETLILLPMMIWGFIALVVYWDIFRVINTTQKAAYSIADLLSRQGVITSSFVNGIDNINTFLTPGSPDAKILITSLQFDAAKNNYCLIFSISPNNKVTTVYTQATVQALKPQIPILSDLESVVIVETWVQYDPAFRTGAMNFAPGVSSQVLKQFIVTRPRNWRRVVLSTPATTCV